MAGKNKDAVFAGLVDVDEGPLTESTIHVTKLSVEGDIEWAYWPFLCSVSENRAMLFFRMQNSMWYCDVKERTLRMRRLETTMPSYGGFCSLPFCLPNGSLLVVGERLGSDDITLISCGEEPTFDIVGKVPRAKGCYTSLVLVGERFMVGFGGEEDFIFLDNLWTFDLQSHKSSAIAKDGDWHLQDTLVPLVVQDDTLYLIGGENTPFINSISLQALSELIQDIDVQTAFQTSLGLEPRQYPPIERETCDFPGMHDLRGYFPGYLSYNTIDHEGRVFHFSQEQRKLCVTEVLLGSSVKTKKVNTGVDCGVDGDYSIFCCSFGHRILIAANKLDGVDVFYAIVTIDHGVMTKESIHVERKRVVVPEECGFLAFVTQISENTVWALYENSSEIWVGELRGEEIVMTERRDYVPIWWELCASPLCLSDGRLLATGTNETSAIIALITPREHFSFEKIRDIPGGRRQGVSIAILAERFVIGLGGNILRHPEIAWILDLQTYRISLIREVKEWRKMTYEPFLVVKNQTLYIIGGVIAEFINSLSITALSRLILNGGVRAAFCGWFGIPFQPTIRIEARCVKYYVPPSL